MSVAACAVPSATPSATPVTVTDCCVVPLSGVKRSEAGETVPSVVLLLLRPRVTSAVRSGGTGGRNLGLPPAPGSGGARGGVVAGGAGGDWGGGGRGRGDGEGARPAGLWLGIGPSPWMLTPIRLCSISVSSSVRSGGMP